MTALEKTSIMQLARADQVSRRKSRSPRRGSVTELAREQPPKTRYAHLGDIARGGMGQVALVHDAEVERQIAMKRLLPEFTVSDDHVTEFIAEARVLGRLEHPNIVPLYDLGVSESGDSYFTMQYVKGRTLADVIGSLKAGNVEDHKRFTWSRRAQIIQQVCDAVAYAHERGIAHRDLKPANIMFGEHGEVIVMDWGLASGSLEEGSPQTTSTVCGTPAYLCPEAISHQPVSNVARDVYALGVLAYEFFSLKLPFPGTNLQAVLVNVATGTPDPVYEVRQRGQRAVPVEIHHIVRRAMAKNPADRYASCLELREALQLYLDGRFPIRCPSTALKRWTLALAHSIDTHPKLAVLLSSATVVVAILATLTMLVPG